LAPGELGSDHAFNNGGLTPISHDPYFAKRTPKIAGRDSFLVPMGSV